MTFDAASDAASDMETQWFDRPVPRHQYTVADVMAAWWWRAFWNGEMERLLAAMEARQ